MAKTSIDIPQLRFNKMSTAKYEELKQAGQLVDNEFYITPDVSSSDIPAISSSTNDYVLSNDGNQLNWIQESEYTKNRIDSKLNGNVITNCITKIPQDIKIELSNGVLTLKAGSVTYFPNGAGVFTKVTVPEDKSLTNIIGVTGQLVLYTDTTGHSIGFRDIEHCYSGTSDTATRATTYYNTTTNKIIQYGGDGTQTQVTFPCCLFTVNNGTIVSIDQVFNGLGYIGSTIFALPGVEGLIPNGFDTEGKLSNVKIINENVLTLTPSFNGDSVLLLGNNNFTAWGKPDYSYHYDKNFVYFKDGNHYALCKIGEYYKDSAGSITSLTPKTTFQAVDYNEYSKDITEIKESISDKVSLTKDEEISGVKTFTDDIIAPNQLDYTNITNCITKIPQDIKLELNNGTLTLKAGSKVYNADGSVYVLDNDLSRTPNWGVLTGKSTGIMVFPAISNNKITGIDALYQSLVFSGDTAPTFSGNYACWLDTVNKKVKYTNDAGVTWLENRAFPLCLVSTTDNTVTSIDQIFNGFGFMGSAIFVLPGVEGLIPNGSHEDGSLNNIQINQTQVTIREFSANTLVLLTYSSNDIRWNSSAKYDYRDNYVYNNAGKLQQIVLGTAIYKNNKVISLTPKLPIRVPDIQEVVTKDEYLTENEIQRQIFNRIYNGRDLTKIFANEIAKYSDEWAWIKARISSANYEGLYVGDYIPVTMNAGTVGGTSIAQQTFQCQIAGIDTYTGCGDTEIGHHIDFISREVIDSTVIWNPENNNNGTSVQANPWLASQAYAYLNGVNNYTTSAYNNVAHGGDYSAGGILQLLPTKLTNLIVTKRNLLDSRYDSTKLLTYSTTWVWGDMGKLWLPNEIEVYGTQIRSNLGYAQGYWNPEANIAVAYPIYLGSGRNRIKRVSSGGRSTWWLSSAVSHNSTNVCLVHGHGHATSRYATYASIRCPLCFRIA